VKSPSSLALATLGGTTQIGSFLFLVASPKAAKASSVTCHHRPIACCCPWNYHAKLWQLVRSITCLSNLGQSNTNRNNPICVLPPNVSKASTGGDTAAAQKNRQENNCLKLPQMSN